MISRFTAWMLIRPGEGRLLVYLAGLNILLGLGMAIARSSSDALFFKRYGVEYLPHMLFLTSVLLVVVSTVYATLVDRMHPGRLFNLVFAAICLYLLLVWGALHFNHDMIAFALYYVGYGVMSEILVMHYSYYALSYFDTLQAKRLFPVVGAAARLGAVLGGVAMGLGSAVIAPENAVLAWAATLIAAMWLVHRRHRGEPATPRSRAKRRGSPLDDVREGMQFARHSRLLQFTALGVFILILVVSVQDYVASTILTHHFADASSMAAFFGWFFAFTNGIVLVMQLFATNRLLQRFGLEKVNLIFPVATVVSMALLTLSGGYWSALVARFNYMGMLPAFRIPSASLFYNALPTYIQGRARALVYGFMLPAGMALSGLLLMLVPPTAVDARLSALGLILALIYLLLKLRKNHHYGDALLSVLQRQVFSGRSAQLDGPGLLPERVIEAMEDQLKNCQDDEMRLSIAELLVTQAPGQAGPILLKLAPTLPSPMQDRLLKWLGQLRPEGWQAYARSCLNHVDYHLRTTALTQLVEADAPNTTPLIANWLHSDSVRLRALAARLAITSSDSALAGEGQAVLDDLIHAPSQDRQLAGLWGIDQLGCPKRSARLHELADSPTARIRLATLHTLSRLASPAGIDLGDLLTKLARDSSPEVRVAVVKALFAASDPDLRLHLLAQLLDDPDRQVRAAASQPSLAYLPADAEVCQAACMAYFDHFEMQSLICQSLAQSQEAARRDRLIDIAARHIEAARGKQALWQALANAEMARRLPDSLYILDTVLAEDVQRHIDLILDILFLLDQTMASQTIRAALASRDRGLRAQAMESLRHLEHFAMLKRLIPLLEGAKDVEMDHAVRAWDNRSWQEILAWCEREGSRWLSRCAGALTAKT